jgi:glycosyltransferase involved in cell wall biosynthesis
MTDISMAGTRLEPASVVEAEPAVLQIIDDLQVGGAQSLLVSMSAPGATRFGMRILDLAGRETINSTRLSAAGVEVERLRVSRLASPAGWMRLFWRLKTAPERIVHLHLSWATVMAAPLAKLLGKKVVVTLHNVDGRQKRNLHGRLVRHLETLCLRHCVDCVIAVGEEVLTTNRRRIGAAEINILLNAVAPPTPVDPAARDRKRRELGAADEDVVILACGRLGQQKDHLSLLSAFVQVHADFPNAVLWIAGDGNLRPQLEEAADVLGIKDRVSFLGRRGDIPELIEAADVFALSSAWEGCPVALIEAMARGLAPVATRVGDVPGLVSDRENGLLVEPQNPKELANALLQLCRDRQLRGTLAKNAKTSVKKLTDLEGWRREIATIYAKMR